MPHILPNWLSQIDHKVIHFYQALCQLLLRLYWNHQKRWHFHKICFLYLSNQLVLKKKDDKFPGAGGRYMLKQSHFFLANANSEQIDSCLRVSNFLFFSRLALVSTYSNRPPPYLFQSLQALASYPGMWNCTVGKLLPGFALLKTK